MTNWKEIAAQVQLPTREVRLCLRGDLLTALAEAQANAEAQAEAQANAAPSLGGDPTVDDLQRQVDEATVTFRLKALPRERLRAVEAEHPADDGVGWNLDTFPGALLRECLVEPQVDADERIDAVLTSGQMDQLFEVAIDLCMKADAVPLPRRG